MDGETLPLEAPVTLGELVARLRERGGVWADALSEARSVRAAVNQELASSGSPVRPGDEVALFPPVTGG